MGNDEHIATHIPQLRRYARALSGEVGKNDLLRVADAVYQKLNP